jgi:glucan phosphoethanolaminetransferase (alkaline phosphatase superfamily)
MERTTFVYDSDYSKEYSKQSCIKIFIIYFILALFFILSIYIIFFDYEDRNFIILLMTGFIFVSLILNILIWYKKQIKEYNSFNLHITDG